MYSKSSARNMNRVTVLSIKGPEITLHCIHRHCFDTFTDAFFYAVIRDFFYLVNYKGSIAAYICLSQTVKIYTGKSYSISP